MHPRKGKVLGSYFPRSEKALALEWAGGLSSMGETGNGVEFGVQEWDEGKWGGGEGKRRPGHLF